jgi:hypothetical protein
MQKYSELVYNLISLKANEMLYFRNHTFPAQSESGGW